MTIQHRLASAHSKYPRGPKLFVLSSRDWRDYYDSLSDEVKDFYERFGYYNASVVDGVIRITRNSSGPTCLTFKGVPVVKLRGYQALKNRLPDISGVARI